MQGNSINLYFYCFARVRGVAMISKLFTFQIFPNLGPRKGGGGVFKFLLFPKFKKVPIILGGTLGSDVTLNS